MLFSDKDDSKPCISRRNFLLAGASSVALTSVPGLSVALEGAVKPYPRKKVADIRDLKQDEQIYFRYPVEDSIYANNFLVRLGSEAGGGIGKDRDIVAYSSYCPHMGGPLNGHYNKEHKVAGPCPLHLSTFDLTRHGMVISGHATESLPQVILELEGNNIYATGIMGLVYGQHQNINI